MRKTALLITLCLIVISACAPVVTPTAESHLSPNNTTTEKTAAATATPTPSPSESPTPTASPLAPLSAPLKVTELAPQPTVFPTPAATLIPEPEESLQGHEIVLRIHNVDKLTGRAGQLTRWLAWGSPAFTIAPDGNYWLVDVTNRAFRVVQLDPSGELLETVPLQAWGGHDISEIAADRDLVWLLDYDFEGNVIVTQIDRQSGSQRRFIPPPEYQHGIYGLALDEEAGLLLERYGGVFVTRLTSQEGQFFLQDLPGYRYAGKLYRMAIDEDCFKCFQKGPPFSEHRQLCNVQGPMMVDEFPVRVAGIDQNNYMRFLGAASDGSFYVAGMVHSGDLAVQRYSPEGQLTGVARPPAGHFYVPDYHDLAVGPDGALYAMVSLDDQDVVVVRMNFGDQLPVLPTPTPYVEPTPMTPPRPAWETPPPDATGEDIARETLLAFFARLSDRRYAKAGELYGGGMAAFAPYCEEYPDFCEQLASVEGDPAEFWKAACSMLLACLPIGNIAEVEQVSATEYRLWVEHTWEDGYRYTAHACCNGNPAMTPFVWLYPYRLRQNDGQYQVMEPPPVLK